MRFYSFVGLFLYPLPGAVADDSSLDSDGIILEVGRPEGADLRSAHGAERRKHGSGFYFRIFPFEVCQQLLELFVGGNIDIRHDHHGKCDRDAADPGHGERRAKQTIAVLYVFRLIVFLQHIGYP